MKKWIVMSAIVLLAFAFAITWKAARQGEDVSDETRIRQVLEEGRQAVSQRNMRLAMVCISRDYNDQAGLNYEKLKIQGGRALQTLNGIDVNMDCPRIDIRGKKAYAKINVEVATSLGGMPAPATNFTANVSLAKEPARKWLIFPVTRWRVTSMDGVPISKFAEG